MFFLYISPIYVSHDKTTTGATASKVSMTPSIGASWEFRYTVIRVWERPATDFLNGPLGLVPLAPLAHVHESELPTTISEMRSRIEAQPGRPLAAKLWTASFLLMGLRFDEAVINNVLSGVMQMEESVTYQAILRRGVEQGLREGRTEGRAEEAISMLLLQGGEKFGAPAAEQENALRATRDLTKLETLIKKMLKANTWDELLAGA